MTFSRDNEAFLRSQGWSGTRWDEPRDSSYTDKDKHIYDSLLKAAGDDKQLTTAEYETIYNDRGPWGKYAYNRDSVANALAKLGSQTGIKLDQETMDRHDLTYSGDDILQRVQGGARGPDAKTKDEDGVSFERSYTEDDDDTFNIFRYKAKEIEEEKEEEEKPEEPEDPTCPAGTRSGANGRCIADDDYLDFNKDYGDGGSIHYLTPHMSDQYKPGAGSVHYKPNVGSGKFSGFLRANQYQQDRSN